MHLRMHDCIENIRNYNAAESFNCRIICAPIKCKHDNVIQALIYLISVLVDSYNHNTNEIAGSDIELKNRRYILMKAKRGNQSAS